MTKIIKEFPNYVVCSTGKIFNKDKLMLKPSLSNSGYLYVTLYNEGKRKKMYIHRLVAEHFLSESLYDKVNHKDGDKLNNALSNLEWCDTSYNTKHAYDTGLISKKTVLDKIVPEDLYNNYKSGSSMLSIAKSYDVGITSVSKYITKYVRTHNLQDEFIKLKTLHRTKQ